MEQLRKLSRTEFVKERVSMILKESARKGELQGFRIDLDEELTATKFNKAVSNVFSPDKFLVQDNDKFVEVLPLEIFNSPKKNVEYNCTDIGAYEYDLYLEEMHKLKKQFHIALNVVKMNKITMHMTKAVFRDIFFSSRKSLISTIEKIYKKDISPLKVEIIDDNDNITIKISK